MLQVFDVKMRRLPTIKLPEGAYTAFADFAEANGKTLSQAVREAMQEYAAKRGLIIDFNVGGWGGYRDRDNKDDSET